MARPRKKGLDYFPLDVDFFQDKKIKRLRARFGSNGVEVYIYLLCEIYRNGYYIDYDEDLILDISDEVNISENAAKQIMNYLLSRSLFNDKLAKSVKVLTAESIQRRYQEAKKGGKTDIEVEAKFWVLPLEDTLDFVKVRPLKGFSEINLGFSEKNSDDSENNNTKKSKEKESKENKSIIFLSDQNQPEELSAYGRIPSFEEVAAYIQEIGGGVDAVRFYNTYTAQGWKTKNGSPITDWKSTVRYWQSNEGKFKAKPKSKSVPECKNADAYKSLVYNLDE